MFYTNLLLYVNIQITLFITLINLNEIEKFANIQFN